MSAALVERTGPWTPDDVEAWPDAGDHARIVAPSTVSIDRAIKPFAVELDPADLTRRTG